MMKLPPLAIAASCALMACDIGRLTAQGRDLRTPPVDIKIAESFEVPTVDEKSMAIIELSNAFLATLSDEQREAAVFPFADNAQRSNWSNFPHPHVPRAGVMRADMTDQQLSALDQLLIELLSESGFRNIVYQLAADEASDTGRSSPLFGEEYYFVSFLGEHSADAPWMLQFGGHHLAINATMFGSDISFSPMLTGGEPLNLTIDGSEVFITRNEVMAAMELLGSLDDKQRDKAVRSNKPTDLLLGPGKHGVIPLPEGISGSELSPQQKVLFIELISQRVGFINEDDSAARMEEVSADLDNTYFGWWGSQEVPGAAYYRISGPSLVIEYSPEGDDNSADHAHNMYRNPVNDYGQAWISE